MGFSHSVEGVGESKSNSEEEVDKKNTNGGSYKERNVMRGKGSNGGGEICISNSDRESFCLPIPKCEAGDFLAISLANTNMSFRIEHFTIWNGIFCV